MTATERESFLAERIGGIGGSEAAAPFNHAPYHCARKTCYEKRGVQANFPFTGNADTERGTRLEPIVSEMYAEQTGRRVVRGLPMFRHAEDHHLIVHVDGLIYRPESPDVAGVHEIKCPRVRGFLKAKREGLPESYILQLQHAMLVTGLTWGAFTVFSAELWELVYFDVERDEVLIDQLRLAAGRLWKQVTEGPMPDRLDPGSVQCQKCPYRTTCQGVAMMEAVGTVDDDADESLADLFRENVEAGNLYDEAEELKEAARDRLRAAMGTRPVACCSAGKISYRPHEVNRLDTKGIKADLPDVAARYNRVSIGRPLRLYPTKG